MKCLTRQWLELTISAYRSRIAYLPHCTRLCYPERNASLFLNCMILLTEKKGFQPMPNNKTIFKLSHQKKSGHKEIWLLWQCGHSYSYSFRFYSFMTALYALAYMYIECAHYPQFYAPTKAFRKGFWLYKKWGI